MYDPISKKFRPGHSMRKWVMKQVRPESQPGNSKREIIKRAIGATTGS